MVKYKLIDSEYTEEKKNLKSKFTILYIGSITGLLLVFTALWLFSSSKVETVKAISHEDVEYIALLKEDQLLHESLMNLDQLDINYSKLLTETSDSNTLNNLNSLINTSEISFSNLIDSMSRQKTSFKNPVNAEKSDSILYAFVSALNYRKSNNSLRMQLFGNKMMPGDYPTIGSFQMEIQRKTDTINNLLNQLNFLSNINNTPSFDEQNIPKIKTGTLQSIIKRQGDSIKVLISVYNSLIKDNSNLASQLKSNKNNTDADKINSLNAKIDDLYAELSLAKIDCNLKRVNEKDIIYTSRQRKDLLQESLNSLKSLSSANPLIQRKVKDKLQLLQTIAATVRN